MNQTIEERMLSIEQQLSEIRKELGESLVRYEDKSWLSKDTPQFTPMTPSKFRDKMDKLWEASK
jgi:hypothetical protein